MTDIVERLRNISSVEWCEPMCAEAAAEIERLRAECQRLAGEVSRAHKDALAWMEQAAAADADIERLLAERAEAIATLALYRAENGCTRGQRTTQWCGEAGKLQEALRRIAENAERTDASPYMLLVGCGLIAKKALSHD